MKFWYSKYLIGGFLRTMKIIIECSYQILDGNGSIVESNSGFDILYECIEVGTNNIKTIQ